MFGLPEVKDGKVTAEWEEFNLTYIPLPEPLMLWDGKNKVSRVRCHRRIAGALSAVFNELHLRGFWPNIRMFLGGYNYRKTRGAQSMSRHSWGLAVDFDCVTWVPKKGWEWLIPLLQENEPPPEMVAIFAKNGFYWGGWFSKKDAMHFEWGKIV